MKQGDLVFTKSSSPKMIWETLRTNKNKKNITRTGMISCGEILLVLDVVNKTDQLFNEIKIITPRGEIGWTYSIDLVLI